MSTRWPGWVAVLALAGFVMWAWPQLPARMVTHWNVDFQPDGWSSKAVAAGLFPGLLLVVWLGLPLLRRVDPKRENYAHWEPTFWLVLNILVLMLSGIEAAAIAYNLGWPIEMRQVMLGLVGMMFVGLGNYLPRVKPNWWVGIRTPWSLSSDVVWRETHRVGGWAMALGGLVMIGAAFAPARIGPRLGLGAVLVAVLVPTVYSYLRWRRESGAGGRP